MSTFTLPSDDRYYDFDKEAFEKSVHEALETVQRILDIQRHPYLAGEEIHRNDNNYSHFYHDKYKLANWMTNMTILSQLNCFDFLGLSKDILLQQLLLLLREEKDDEEKEEEKGKKGKKDVATATATATTTKNPKKKRKVILTFQARDSCTFIKEDSIEVPVEKGAAATAIEATQIIMTGATTSSSSSSMSTQNTTTTSTGTTTTATTTTTTAAKRRNVRRVKEYHWNVYISWEISLSSRFKDDDDDDDEEDSDDEDDNEQPPIVLQSRSTTVTVVTRTNQPPTTKKTRIHSPIEVSLQWLFEQLCVVDEVNDGNVTKSTCKDNYSIRSTFCINTAHDKTKTPRRNVYIRDAMKFFTAVQKWSITIRNFLTNITMTPDVLSPNYNQHRQQRATRTSATTMAATTKKKTDVASPTPVGLDSLRYILADDVFIPILPIMKPLVDRQSITGETFSGVAAAAIASATATATATSTISPRTKTNDDDDDVEKNSSSSPILSFHDMNQLLQEQHHSITMQLRQLQKLYPPMQKFVKLYSMAQVIFLCQHSISITVRYLQCMEYIEQMLQGELITAISSKINVHDMDDYMKYHNNNINNKQSKSIPSRPFCYPIRRTSRHHPDGLISIEGFDVMNVSSSSPSMGPIETFTREITHLLPSSSSSSSSSPSSSSSSSSSSIMAVPINAATCLQLNGRAYLHGWVQHRFQQRQHKVYKIIARARQFSSFVLIIGTISTIDTRRKKYCDDESRPYGDGTQKANVASRQQQQQQQQQQSLQPKDAIIVRNKDEVMIPLLFNDMPTNKEFNDRMRSLSAQQQQFVKLYRKMQLESKSLLGIAIIPIKSQVEKVLKLPKTSLTKEIKLTDDILNLFIHYHIPSNLITYDKSGTNNEEKSMDGHTNDDIKAGIRNNTTRQQQQEQEQQNKDETKEGIHDENRLSIVKGHVRAVMDVIRFTGSKRSLETQKMLIAEMAKAKLRENQGTVAGFGTTIGKEEDDNDNDNDDNAKEEEEEKEGFEVSRLFRRTAAAAVAGADVDAGDDEIDVVDDDMDDDGMPGMDWPRSSSSAAAVAVVAAAAEPPTEYNSTNKNNEDADTDTDNVDVDVDVDVDDMEPSVFDHPGDRTFENRTDIEATVTDKKKTVAGDDVVDDDDDDDDECEDGDGDDDDGDNDIENRHFDVTRIPKRLNDMIDKYYGSSDDDGTDSNINIRSVMIETDHTAWTRIRQTDLLTRTVQMETLTDHRHQNTNTTATTTTTTTIRSERNMAIDLLDSLSRSGTLSIDGCQVHIITSIVHSFDRDVMTTIIQDNINPIEKLELSSKIMATTITTNDMM